MEAFLMPNSQGSLPSAFVGTTKNEDPIMCIFYLSKWTEVSLLYCSGLERSASTVNVVSPEANFPPVDFIKSTW